MMFGFHARNISGGVMPSFAAYPNLLACAGICLLLLMTPGALYAQGDRGTITGVVTDASGSAIVGAEITILNPANNLSLRTVSNEVGNYRLVGVPVGTYELKVTSTGFQGYRHVDVQVQTNQTTNIDARLQVGAVTETVTVSGGAIPLISTETMDVGMVVESKRFLDLPLTMSGQMRTPSRFMKLSPGVAPSNTWTETSRRTMKSRHRSRLSANSS
jgi:hypothetical protein